MNVISIMWLPTLSTLLNYVQSLSLVTIFALVIAPIENLHAGEKDGGGGNVIIFKGQNRPFLLDRLMINQNLAFEIEVLQKLEVNAYDYANQKLNLWHEGAAVYNLNTTKAFISLVQQALNGIVITEVPYKFKLINRYYLPPEILRMKPKVITAIVYMDGYGAFVSSPTWTLLSTETQAGLLVHEAIRQIQFRYGFNDLTDKDLQYLTALIMDSSPETTERLLSYMSTQLLNLCLVSGRRYNQGMHGAVGVLMHQHNSQFNSLLDMGQKSNQRNVMSSQSLEQLLSGHIDSDR